jgi:hypothetical protein
MANPNIVNVTSILGGNAGWNLSATTTDTLMTVGSGVIVKLNAITVANVDGTNAADVSVFIGLGIRQRINYSCRLQLFTLKPFQYQQTQH